ncbi:hypothetical protein GRI62_06465 [Erythrobacter arachoides]|uniref:O-antigen ligase-related domain-containing protein n=1 Tax=Aurantiacibacter arachoides TaxID=1850444 RepID=A0A845A6S8_9SPHN|nr:O-antigen ligase family protein [Aurantiacibacter arachoides]MXO93249.1 hypothetical protein [Aurantiacibacter arachoides]
MTTYKTPPVPHDPTTKIVLQTSAGKIDIARFQKLFVSVYFACAAGALANILSAFGNDGESAGPLYQLIWGFLFVLSIPLIISANVKFVSRRELIALSFGLYVLLSTFMTSNPASNFAYASSFLFNLGFAIACARVLGLRTTFKILCKTLNILVAISIFLYFAGFKNAIYFDAIDRSSIIGLVPAQGIFSHKIYAGLYSALSLALNLTLFSRAKRLYLCAMSLALILLSGSSIGLLAGLSVLFCAILLPQVFKKTYGAIIATVVTLLIVISGTIAFMHIDVVFSVLGRDLSLTGRTKLWEIGASYIGERPIFGWGYGGIFDDSAFFLRRFSAFEYYRAPHFHNGLIQICAENGALGLLLFSAIGVAFLRNCRRALSLVHPPTAYLPVMIGVVFVIGLSVMNIGSRYNELMTIVFFIVAVAGKRQIAK